MICNDINNLLPAYLEDILSPEDKKCVEEHLRTCSLCRRNVVHLKKTDDLLHTLEEVEPPPFFEQRIMAAIREENRRKHGILHKFFFPLHIKIPIQALATILITVLAFYVYQKSGPEMKQLAPLPVPMTESVRDQIKPEISIQPSDSPTVPHDKEAPPVSPQVRKRQQFVRLPSAAFPVPQAEEHPSAIASKDAEIMGKTQERAVKEEADKMPAMLAAEQGKKAKKTAAGSAAGARMNMMSAPAPLRATEVSPVNGSSLDLTIQVSETATGLQNIEACLSRFNARIMERQQRGGKTFLNAEIDARHVAAFVRQMEEIGRLRIDHSRLDNPAGNVMVNIKIDHLP
jgi:hypothetical protein